MSYMLAMPQTGAQVEEKSAPSLLGKKRFSILFVVRFWEVFGIMSSCLFDALLGNDKRSTLGARA
jgi:hypothetical protein